MGKCKAYQEKAKIDINYHNVLLPKSTGLYYILCNLNSEYFYDFTIGYPEVEKGKGKYAHDKYDPISFLLGEAPKEVHICINRFKINEIPGLKKRVSDSCETVDLEFDSWLKNRFVKKDAMLSYFYNHGTFDHSGSVKKISITMDPMQFFIIKFTVLCLIISAVALCFK